MKRRLFGLFIALIFAMQMLVGCSGGDPTPSGKIYPDTLPEYTASDDKVMFIGGFAKPRVMTLEAYQDIADCGIGYILIDPWFAGTNINNEAQICRALELCEQAGIKGFIMPNNTHEVEDESTYVSFEDFSVDYMSVLVSAGGGTVIFSRLELPMTTVSAGVSSEPVSEEVVVVSTDCGSTTSN